VTKTIVLLGAEIHNFARGKVESLIVKGGEGDVRLVDVDLECLQVATLLSTKLVELHDAPVTVTSSLEWT
jgi:hypothetical protein